MPSNKSEGYKYEWYIKFLMCGKCYKFDYIIEHRKTTVGCHKYPNQS